jgi:hypothetical protein
MSTLQDKFTALVTARQTRVAAQALESATTHALFNQADPSDEVIKPGQAAADVAEKIVYANVAGQGQTFELVGYIPTPPAA